MKVIVGLGNPGKEYANTRHNIGFMTIDKLSEKTGIEIKENKLKSLMGKGQIGAEKVILVKPLTFMNSSGEALRAVMDFYKLEPKDFIVIYDDIDLAPGQLRIRERGAAGTHNGMKSVIQHLGTEEFTRIRVGVGAQPEGWDLVDYVLGNLSGKDGDIVKEGIDDAVKATELIIDGKLSDAMTTYNAKKIG